MQAAPKVLVVWGQYPRWIPPAILSTRQVTLAARLKDTGGFAKKSRRMSFDYFDAFEPQGWIGAGTFDLAEYCDRHGLGRDFDYVVVFAEQDTGVYPTNIQAFGCPAILLVGDTHHFPAPISTLIDYAQREKFQGIVCQFACHHLHWFVKAGFETCVAIPGLITCHKPVAWQQNRSDVIAFVGHTWKYHFYRHVLLNELQRAGLPLAVVRGTRETSAHAYAEALISFNCSLNSDINVRNFEVLSSRGFLITERLPDVTGFSKLFQPGSACETYADAEELLSKIAFYRSHPDAALQMARRGHELFCSTLAPEHALRTFRSIFFHGAADEEQRSHDWRCKAAAGTDWRKRLETYEKIQELHRQNLEVSVCVEPGATWFDASDYLDLPRVKLHWATSRAASGKGSTGKPASNGSGWNHVVSA